MKTTSKIALAAVAAVVAIYYKGEMGAAGGIDRNFSEPPRASMASGDIERISTHEFTDLFQNSTATSTLAVAGHYTVVEGYINTCGICRVLESKFEPFLDNRRDVVIRRVHLPENGFSLSSEEEFRRLALYRNHDVNLEKGTLGVCGTPHVEIYGPDQQIVATDECSNDNDKSGLTYLNSWIAAEI
jgi:hypothetical protein